MVPCISAGISFFYYFLFLLRRFGITDDVGREGGFGSSVHNDSNILSPFLPR